VDPAAARLRLWPWRPPTTSTPSTTTPPTTAQDTEARQRAQLEVERFCMTQFPDHCTGVVLVMGRAATAIKVEPVGRKPTPQELAAFRRKPEQLTGEKMTDEEFASFMKLSEQFPQPSPEQLARFLGDAGIPGFDLSGRNRLVVYWRPWRRWTPRYGSGSLAWATTSASPTPPTPSRSWTSSAGAS
jgi:hypothetical protein